jgi:hypothetical protein
MIQTGRLFVLPASGNGLFLSRRIAITVRAIKKRLNRKCWVQLKYSMTPPQEQGSLPPFRIMSRMYTENKIRINTDPYKPVILFDGRISKVAIRSSVRGIPQEIKKA